MTTWTNEMRETVSTIMDKVAGMKWYDATWSEAMCDKVCEACPYSEGCGTSGQFYGCANWEESMGEDL